MALRIKNMSQFLSESAKLCPSGIRGATPFIPLVPMRGLYYPFNNVPIVFAQVARTGFEPASTRMKILPLNQYALRAIGLTF